MELRAAQVGTVVVFGSGGNLGRALTACLVEDGGSRGECVVRLSRSSDLTDVDAVLRSAKVAPERVVVITPQLFAPHDVRVAGEAIARAAARRGVAQVVYIACCGIDARSRRTSRSQGPFGEAHAAAEDAFRERDIPLTSVRATSLISNLLNFHGYEITRLKRIRSAIGATVKLNWVDPRDVAAVVRCVLLDKVAAHDGAVYDVTGPAGNTLSYLQLADLLGEELDTHVQFEHVAGSYQEYLEYQSFVRAGGFDFHSRTVHQLTGNEPLTIRSFIRQHRSELNRGETMSAFIARQQQYL